MKLHARRALLLAAAAFPFLAAPLSAQPRVNSQIYIKDAFDKDKDGVLSAAERKLARAYAWSLGSLANRGQAGVPKGPLLTPKDVKTYGPDVPLFDVNTLRTLFIEFETSDWEAELADFYETDITVPAKVTVDGKVYNDVGIGFRGHSSYTQVPAGLKRSLDLGFDDTHEDQRLLGFRSLKLLNANGDPSLLRTFLSHHLARQINLPSPRVNFVRVVINGESWGVYVNTEPVNSDLTRDQFNSAKGARWKIPGNPGGYGGMAYIGDDPSSYRAYYEIKSGDKPESWAALAKVTKVLGTAPLDRLEKELEPLLDIEHALKFLAVDKVISGSDGYWTRASDYFLYMDPSGRFHPIMWDVNETWRDNSRGGGGAYLEPFAGASAQKALYRLTSVPALRKRYLAILRDIAENHLAWSRLEPVIRGVHALLLEDMKTDTHQHYDANAFVAAATLDYGYSSSGSGLKSFADRRREYLLSHPEIAALAPAAQPASASGRPTGNNP